MLVFLAMSLVLISTKNLSISPDRAKSMLNFADYSDGVD